MTKQSRGLLVYIKSSIPSRQLSYGIICDSIQAIPFEINLRQEKWLVISILSPAVPRQWIFYTFFNKNY